MRTKDTRCWRRDRGGRIRTTNPEAWNRLCGGPGGPGLVFRRGIGIALELSEAFIQPGRRWLDIGCGTGQLLGGLSGAGAAAAGIDLDPRMLALARRNAPSIPFAVARAGQLPFGVSTFDGVTATSLMGCVDEAVPVCAEFRRVLTPGGHALVTFTNRDSWLLKLNYAFGRRRGEGYRLYGASEVVAALQGATKTHVSIQLNTACQSNQLSHVCLDAPNPFVDDPIGML